MRNIFLIQTLAESRIAVKSDNTLVLTNLSHPNSPNFTNHHIYITNDEKIKEGYWCYSEMDGIGKWCGVILSHEPQPKKIILTTDPDLIKDGVQAIPNEFLEWFVLNSTCEFVETKYLPQNDAFEPYLIVIKMETKDGKQPLSTKLHIGEVVDESYPEEFKTNLETLSNPETLEEAAEKYLNKCVAQGRLTGYCDEDFIAGAQWREGQIDELLVMLKRSMDEINHIKFTYKDKGHCVKYLSDCEALIEKFKKKP